MVLFSTRVAASARTTYLEHVDGPATPGRIAVESARWHVVHENLAGADSAGPFGVGATLELSVSARLGWYPASGVWLSRRRLNAGFRGVAGDVQARGFKVPISR